MIGAERRFLLICHDSSPNFVLFVSFVVIPSLRQPETISLKQGNSPIVSLKHIGLCFLQHHLIKKDIISMRTELIRIETPTHPLDGAYYTPDGPSKGAIMYC